MKISGYGLFLLLVLSSCVQEMGLEGRLLPYGALDDKPVARPIPDNTIARGHLNPDVENNKPTNFLTRSALERGRERYDIFCTPCHGLSGNGHGLVVERGFKEPPSFHEERLRAMPDQHFFEVIRDGFGVMPSFKGRISASDSWAITAYIKALQLSQHVRLKELPSLVQQKILRELK